ncbi:SH3-domain-containing protein [Gymnopus androsaceus JB14]|uniref:SH3-domain-containing protein n=1 Tax=Gymnopus androsaceus JB14 TaxID=1447944 RepID=A0A6A4HKP3_9AGAR|nr:SH3-domain-containing protein [Gymnopus androsaceus JB14]
MVFSNLNDQEKNSFFSLLDEYFQSRPELAAKLQGAGGDDVRQVAGRVAAAASAFGSSNAPPPARRAPAKTIDPPAGLLSKQRIGDVDTSSKKNMLVSGLSRKQPTTNSMPTIPSAFAAKKSSFTNREPEPEPESKEQGEWAEALYDYDSQDPADLQIRANQRVLVTERTSDDWWKGEVDGQSGLFPAAYVNLL